MKYDYFTVYTDRPHWERDLDQAGESGYHVVDSFPHLNGRYIIMERETPPHYGSTGVK